MRTRITRLTRLTFASAVALTAAATTASAAGDFWNRIPRRATHTHRLWVGMSDHWLTVEGNGSTDLDCWVYDSQDVLVDSDTDSSDYCVLSTPGTGNHRLVVRNLGSRSNRYTVQQLETLL